jgi:sugar lactone lactonase YvrE
VAVALFVLVLVAFTVLPECGGSGHATKYLFVADDSNSRVLVYNAPFVTGQNAATVLGQAAFNTAASPTPPTAASMNFPQLAMDAAGTLYVSDTENCRVLQFTPPFTNGMSATLAIGQAAGAGNLTSNTCLQGAAATATGLASSAGLAVDTAGNLWVADSLNSWVLKYPAPITAGEAATVVLGQTTLTGAGSCNQGNAAPSATTLCNIAGLAFDSAGNLWLADLTNNRVLMYSAASLRTNGAVAATVELGQPAATAFTTGTANNGGVSATSINVPQIIAFDSAGNL